MKFRRGGHLAKSDVITCNSNPIEFVSKITYLGVVFQTKGTLTGHIDHLRNKGIAACAKVAARMPLSKMSPAILARLFLAVVLLSATYGLSSIHTNETLDFLDEVQGRLIVHGGVTWPPIGYAVLSLFWRHHTVDSVTPAMGKPWPIWCFR